MFTDRRSDKQTIRRRTTCDQKSSRSLSSGELKTIFYIKVLPIFLHFTLKSAFDHQKKLYSLHNKNDKKVKMFDTEIQVNDCNFSCIAISLDTQGKQDKTTKYIIQVEMVSID